MLSSTSMKFKITAKDEVKNTITVAFLKDDGTTFKTVTMMGRGALPVGNAAALDQELAKQAQAMEHEVSEAASVYDTKIVLNTVKDATTVLAEKVVVAEEIVK